MSDPIDLPVSHYSPVCPVGELHCDFLSELQALRTQVNLLTEQIHTDALTGIYNVRYFRQILDQEMERTRRTGQATTLIMVDLDHFKAVNDNWGHENGNQVLIQTARLLTQGTRRLDIPCRYGGEEFIIVLPSTELITAIQVAERLRYMIENAPVSIGDKNINITASFGVASYRQAATMDYEESAESFIKRADEQLYNAKHKGRNCVCHGTTLVADTNISSAERDALFGLFSNDESE